MNEPGKKRIVLSFGKARTGRTLLRLSHLLWKEADRTALHFAPDPSVTNEQAAYYVAESFESIKDEADRIGVYVQFIYRSAKNFTKAILDYIEDHGDGWLMLGASGNVESSDPLGGRVGEILQGSKQNIAIIIDDEQTEQQPPTDENKISSMLIIEAESEQRRQQIRDLFDNTDDSTVQIQYLAANEIKNKNLSELKPKPLLVMDIETYHNNIELQGQPCLILRFS